MLMKDHIISIGLTSLLLTLAAVNDTVQSVERGYAVNTKNMPAESPRARSRWPRRVEGYYKGRITPHWLGDNTCFWYRNDLSGETREFILVNAGQGTRRAAFDHKKLAAVLSKAAGVEYQAEQLPFDAIEFIADDNVIRFTVDETTWTCDLASYNCVKTNSGPVESSAGPDEDASPFGRRRGGPGRARGPSSESPDGRWTAVVKDNNVFVRARDDDGDIQLTTDGAEGKAYGRLSWAPDSRTLVAYRVEPGDNKQVHLIESSPAEGGRARLHSRAYALPGDKFATYELNLFDIRTRKQIKPDVEPLELDWQVPRLHWKKDQRHFAYEKIDRGHQRLMTRRQRRQKYRSRKSSGGTAFLFFFR